MNKLKNLVALFLCFTSFALAQPKLIHLQKGQQYIAVLGTIHIAKPNFYPLPNAVIDTLNKAQVLAVEIDLSTIENQVKLNETIAKAALSSKGNQLDNQRLEKLEKVLGKQYSQLGVEPWFLSIVISLERIKRLGFTATGIDEKLISLAIKQKKKVISLERPEEQISIFSQIPYSESLQLFDASISENFENELKKTVKIWQENDVKIAEETHQKMQKETPVLYRLINNKRNKNLANRIADYSKKHQTLFVAIGSMHLYGKGSVIELLQSKGFKIQTQ